MLEVRVDLVPYGQEAYRQTLETIYIGRDETSTHEVGNYDVYTSDPRTQPLEDKSRRSDREGWIGRVEGFSRDRGRTALAGEAIALVEQGGGTIQAL